MEKIIPLNEESAWNRIQELDSKFQEITNNLDDREFNSARQPIDNEMGKIFDMFPNLKNKYENEI